MLAKEAIMGWVAGPNAHTVKDKTTEVLEDTAAAGMHKSVTEKEICPLSGVRRQWMRWEQAVHATKEEALQEQAEIIAQVAAYEAREAIQRERDEKVLALLTDEYQSIEKLCAGGAKAWIIRSTLVRLVSREAIEQSYDPHDSHARPLFRRKQKQSGKKTEAQAARQ
jgi:hypothetical protein